MRHHLGPWLALLLSGWAPVAAWAAGDYQTLRAGRPDGRRLTLTQPLTLERDAFRFELASGTVHFLAPLAGRTWGAVFLGSGRFRLSPATADERRHLAMMSGKADLENLEDGFDSLLLLFGDDTAEELGLAGTIENGAPDSRAQDVFDAFIRRQRKDFKTNFLVRVLEDLLDTPALKSGVFMAFLNGRELPPALAAVDPRGVEALHIAPLMGGEDSVLFVGDEVRGGFWYACDRKGEIARGRRTPFKPTVDGVHYTIDTEIRRNEELLGTTTIDFKAEVPVRVVPLRLVSTLRIKEASFKLAEAAEWTAVPWVQEQEKEDADPALVLPEILPKGTAFSVRLRYEGKEVVYDGGLETWFVSARESWYPNAGIFTDPATFDLTFRVPAGLEVVATGSRTSDTVEGKTAVSVWKTAEPIRVAGFNYGRFIHVDRPDEVSGIEIGVYANSKGINFSGRSNRSEISDTELGPDSAQVISVAPDEQTGRRDPKDLAADVAVDGVNASRLFYTYFGPIPQHRVAVTQQISFSFGQSWPSLVFLPYSAFLTGTARKTIGLAGFGYDQFVQRVGFHEMAHQWWGHHVGWESYRDQWLSEGFAEFSAALAVQRTEGWDAYSRIWQEARKNILSRTGTLAAYDVGPISRGHRLSTAKSPAAYPILIYSKGAFVLHMLRMLMWNGGSLDPDAGFVAMMKDFTATWAGRSPSTADFKEVVARHMVPTLNATMDGKVDWFFDQWVDGTELPILTSNLKADKVGEGEYKVTGTVGVAGVSGGFKLLVPLYADLGKGKLVSFGRVPFSGPASRQIDVTVKLPEKPKRLLVNGRHEILTRDE